MSQKRISRFIIYRAIWIHPGWMIAVTVELILLALVLLFVGFLVLIFIIKSLLYFLPSIVIAIVVFLITSSFLWAGVGFLLITVLMVIVKH